MTPVHIAHQGGSITVVGVTISLHIAGMYGLAPLVGLLVDRWGGRPTIGVFPVSLAIAATRSTHLGWIMVSLVLLGVGWSLVNVSGSAMFSAAVSDESRASAQGGVDALSNLWCHGGLRRGTVAGADQLRGAGPVRGRGSAATCGAHRGAPGPADLTSTSADHRGGECRRPRRWQRHRTWPTPRPGRVQVGESSRGSLPQVSPAPGIASRRRRV
ncbi:MAG: MFS transporter [Propioniciclava sp.]